MLHYYLCEIRVLESQRNKKVFNGITYLHPVFNSKSLYIYVCYLLEAKIYQKIFQDHDFSGFWNLPPFFPYVYHGEKSGKFQDPEKIMVLKFVLIFFSPLVANKNYLIFGKVIKYSAVRSDISRGKRLRCSRCTI